MNDVEELEREIAALEERLRDRELALPAHSIRPSQLLLIEELEEEIKEKKERLAALKA
ncbi:MAG: histidine kinase [Deltaproteobacteria bacterium]|nr:histidine kinase [Deltaproteobacteria bacterium]